MTKITIDISDDELIEEARKVILENVRKNAIDKLQYWVRKEVYDILSKEVIRKLMKEHFTEDELRNLAITAMEKVMREKFGE